jgi:hypothetical protein
MLSLVRWPTSDVYQEWALGVIEPLPIPTVALAAPATIEGRSRKAVLAKGNKRYSGGMPK